MIALVHLLLPRFGFIHKPGNAWVPASAGVAMSYVFMDIFPHLAKSHAKLLNTAGSDLYSFLTHHRNCRRFALATLLIPRRWAYCYRNDLRIAADTIISAIRGIPGRLPGVFDYCSGSRICHVDWVKPLDHFTSLRHSRTQCVGKLNPVTDPQAVLLRDLIQQKCGLY